MHTETLADALITRLGGVVEKTKLQKLMYYANAWNLAIVGEPLVPLPFRAWTFGPVMEPIWRERQDEEMRDADHRPAPRLEAFTSRLLDMVVEEYGHRSSTELSAMSHAESPWLQARGDTPEGEPSRQVIDSEIIAEHYRSMHELCGHRASELAVLGLPDGEVQGNTPLIVAEPVAIDDLPEDEWGGANLFVVPGSQAR